MSLSTSLRRVRARWAAVALRVTLAAGGIALALGSTACSRQEPGPPRLIREEPLPSGTVLRCYERDNGFGYCTFEDAKPMRAGKPCASTLSVTNTDEGCPAR